MVGDGAPVHPKGVGCGGGQDSVQTSLIFPRQTGKTFLYVPDVAHGDAVATTDFL